MRVAIMGSGGLGGIFGGLQARAGFDVSFIARGANLEVLREQGLTVRLLDEDFHLAVRATDNPSEIGPVDAVWFCVKTYDVEAAARQIIPLVGPDTLILPMQNGVGTAEYLSETLGKGHVLGAVALGGGATLVSPGVVEAKGNRYRLIAGELLESDSAHVDRLRETLAPTGIEIQVSADIQAEIWDKFVVACMTLGLCALMRLPLAPILAQQESSALAFGIMEEAEAIARAKGVNLPSQTSARWVEYLHERVALSPELAGSMYYDIMQGRKLELEAVNGAVVRLGRELGVPTPLNFTLYAALLPFVNGAPETIQPA